MKCPKCNYLGFETGDRCKNCGYDFSLIAVPSQSQSGETDLDLALSPAAAPDTAITPPLLREPPKVYFEPELPLFTPAFDDGSDEPMIKVPATPRPPLAVRRTPQTPRLRAAQKAARMIEPELEFGSEPPVAPPVVELVEAVRARTAARLAAIAAHHEASDAQTRVMAAAIDHALLCAIDLVVVYLTLRMTGLAMDEWLELPLAPLFMFLLLVKLSYFCAFTAIGGQTIGKMIEHIRVVTADDMPVDAALAAKRALAGVISTAALGLGYLPIFFGAERRALHDRVAHTRVIALSSV